MSQDMPEATDAVAISSSLAVSAQVDFHIRPLFQCLGNGPRSTAERRHFSGIGAASRAEAAFFVSLPEHGPFLTIAFSLGSGWPCQCTPQGCFLVLALKHVYLLNRGMQGQGTTRRGSRSRGGRMMLKKFAIPAVFAGALALAAMGAAPQQAQAASKTGNFLLGLAAGVATTAIITSAIQANNRRRYHRRRVYYRYRPRPWTPEWYDYCMSKYRSFNPNTGYYRTYSGRLRFCR